MPSWAGWVLFAAAVVGAAITSRVLRLLKLTGRAATPAALENIRRSRLRAWGLLLVWAWLMLLGVSFGLGADRILLEVQVIMVAGILGLMALGWLSQLRAVRAAAHAQALRISRMARSDSGTVQLGEPEEEESD